MKQSVCFSFFVFLLIVFPLGTLAQKLPADFCLAEPEYNLIKQLNVYRQAHGAAFVPVSAALSYVGQTHTRDLFLNHPDSQGGSLHNWSAAGRWTPFRLDIHKPDKRKMYAKPAELTAYTGNGYELVYYDNTQQALENAWQAWIENPASKALILNTGQWVAFEWQAVGVGVFEGYVSLWLGTRSDPQLPLLCSTDGLTKKALPEHHQADNVGEQAQKQTRFYLIIGSHDNLNAAQRHIKMLKKKGFDRARVLPCKKNFRVSLEDFLTSNEAGKARKSLVDQYPDLWVLKH